MNGFSFAPEATPAHFPQDLTQEELKAVLNAIRVQHQSIKMDIDMEEVLPAGTQDKGQLIVLKHKASVLEQAGIKLKMLDTFQ